MSMYGLLNLKLVGIRLTNKKRDQEAFKIQN